MGTQTLDHGLADVADFIAEQCHTEVPFTRGAGPTGTGAVRLSAHGVDLYRAFSRWCAARDARPGPRGLFYCTLRVWGYPNTTEMVGRARRVRIDRIALAGPR